MTLVIMAAGMASRYGSTKQLDGVGPNGELLLEYSIFDARRAGFTRVVFIIRREIEAQMREFAARLPRDLGVEFAIQDLSQVPAWFVPPADRKKPWGTTHAVLAAKHIVDGPFGVLNADDFYGPDAFIAARAACDEAANSNVGAAVMFPLSATLSDNGAVVRGISQVADGFLVRLEEVTDIRRDAQGVHGRHHGEPRELTGHELASMNFWVFPKHAGEMLVGIFEDFLREHGHREHAESLLPEAVAALMASGALRIRALSAPGPWFGLTHQADRESVRRGLAALVEKGVYPANLWN